MLAGGAGTRLWPLSTDDHPKQFLRIFDSESLLQLAFRRLAAIVGLDNVFVSTNERYRGKVVEQLQLDDSRILVEPARRNTAPAIAVCVTQIERDQPESVIGIFPSDHFIGDDASFASVVEAAFAHAERNDAIVTIGIDPTEPNTGFGYLELGEPLEGSATRLLRFVEKPDLELALEFLRSGRFLWNGGMFVFRADYFRTVLRRSSPDIESLARQFVDAHEADRKGIYESMPSISIDYAVMEKAPHVVTVRGNFDWSDVGTWSAVAKRTKSFSAGRVIESGNTSFFHSSRGTPVILAGTKDLIIVETENGLLVMDANQSDALSTYVKKFDDRSAK